MAHSKVILAWVLVSLTACATANETCHTWVLNKSSKDILVTTSYVNFSGHSAFVKRKIPAHGGKGENPAQAVSFIASLVQTHLEHFKDMLFRHL